MFKEVHKVFDVMYFAATSYEIITAYLIVLIAFNKSAYIKF